MLPKMAVVMDTVLTLACLLSLSIVYILPMRRPCWETFLDLLLYVGAIPPPPTLQLDVKHLKIAFYEPSFITLWAILIGYKGWWTVVTAPDWSWAFLFQFYIFFLINLLITYSSSSSSNARNSPSQLQPYTPVGRCSACISAVGTSNSIWTVATTAPD